MQGFSLKHGHNNCNFTCFQSCQQRTACGCLLHCSSSSSINELLQLTQSDAAAATAAAKRINFLEEATGATACKAILWGGGHTQLAAAATVNTQQ